MITFTKAGNSVKVEVGTDVYYLTTDKVVFTRASENKIYLQNEAAANIKAYLSFLPTDVNGRPNDDLLDVAQFLVDDYFTGLSLVSTGGGGPIEDGASAAIKATVLDYTNSNPLAVRLTDTSGDYVSAGGGSQYTEGDVDPTITGTAAMMEVGGNTLQPVQGTVADGLLVNLGTNNDVRLATTTSSTVTSVAASATNVTLLSSNASRTGAAFFNDSTSIAYLKLGATATTSSFTVKMISNSYYELPDPCYTGIIDCIWDSATGSMRITELS